jgi:hypothetical protein
MRKPQIFWDVWSETFGILQQGDCIGDVYIISVMESMFDIIR